MTSADMRLEVRKVALFALLAVVAILSLGGAYSLVQRANVEQARAQKYAIDERNHASVDAKRGCMKVPLPSRPNCENRASEATSQRYHEIDDLEAQRITASWTHYMGVAAILGTGVGVIGILLVLMTFWENKRAADAAHAANRPWLEMKTPRGIEMDFTTDGIGMSALVDVVNHGNSPALRVIAQARLIAKPHSAEDVPTETATHINDLLEGWEKKQPLRGKIIYPGERPADDHLVILANLSADDIRRAEGDVEEHCHFLLSVGISYCVGNERKRTTRSYLVMIKGDIDRLMVPPYNVAENATYRLKDVNLRLVDTHEGTAT